MTQSSIYYSTRYVNIEVGNTISRISGDVPSGLLEEVCNKHLPGLARRVGQRGVRTFDAGLGIFLTGLLPALKHRLRELGIQAHETDDRVNRGSRHAWKLQPGVTLRGYQHACVRAALRHDRGIIAAGTGAGKTLIGAALIAELGVSTIWVTTTRILLEQAAADLERYLGARPAVFGGGRQQQGELTVALVQALDRRPDLVASGRYGLLIFDEGHHAAARTYCATCLRLDARRNYFLTAVPERETEDQVVLDAVTGGVIASVPASDLVAQHWLCPLEIRFTPIAITGAMTELRWETVYKRFLVENDARNQQIVDDARRYADAGESVLVLVDRIAHGQLLLAAGLDDAVFVNGRLPARELAQRVADFAAGRCPVLIATASLFAEGVNIEGTSCIIYAAGLRSRTRTLQAVGRGMRLAPGKDRCLYQDYWDDDDLGRLVAHSQRRREVLAEAGFPAPPAIARPSATADVVVIPTWTHVKGTKQFLRVSATGEILARADCVRPDQVPASFCRRCPEYRTCRRSGGKK